MLVSNCATSGKKKFRFDKNQEPTGLLRDLGLKTSLYKIPVLSNVKKGIPFVQALSLENSADSYLCFRLALLHSVPYFFFLYQSPSSSLCMGFDSLSCNIDEIFSIYPSANVFVFGDFNFHHKDWLTCFCGTDRSGELCYNLSISNDLTQMLNFPTRIPDCGSHSAALLDFFLLMLVFVLQWLSLHWEILIMLLSQFPLTFQLIHNRMPHFIT